MASGCNDILVSEMASKQEDSEMYSKVTLATLALLEDMSQSGRQLLKSVDSLTQKVTQELDTSQGLGFLEMKSNLLLQYLIDLTHISLKKIVGENIATDVSVDRLIEIQTVLEKTKPIQRRLKYQIDKLIKNSVANANIELDPTSFKANPDLLADDNIDSSEEDSGEQVANKERSDDIYKPPMVSAVSYEDDLGPEKRKQNKPKKDKYRVSSPILQDLRDEYLDTPHEFTENNRAQRIITKREKERREYEEEYLTRLPETKADRHNRNRMTTVGTFADELVGNHRISKKTKSKSSHKISKRKIRPY